MLLKEKLKVHKRLIKALEFQSGLWLSSAHSHIIPPYGICQTKV
jgi:hypothetical protein